MTLNACLRDRDAQWIVLSYCLPHPCSAEIAMRCERRASWTDLNRKWAARSIPLVRWRDEGEIWELEWDSRTGSLEGLKMRWIPAYETSLRYREKTQLELIEKHGDDDLSRLLEPIAGRGLPPRAINRWLTV